MKSLIFIGKNPDGQPVSIVLAPTRRDADLYWHGKGLYPHSVRELDPENCGDATPLGVFEILRTRYTTPHGHVTGAQFLVVEKG